MNSTVDTAQSHKARGVALCKAGQYEQALAELHCALKSRPNFPAAYYNIAVVRMEQGRPTDAEAAWRKAIQLKPDYHQAYIALGAVLRQMGRLDDAIAACRRAVEIKPDDSTARNALATALYTARKYKSADVEFQHALRIDPKNVIALNNYANMLSELDRPAQAAQHYRAAIAIEPGRAELYNNLANVLKRQAKIDEAIAGYRKTLQLAPNLWAIHSNLLLTLNCHPRADDGLLAEHVEWANQHAAKVYPPSSFILRPSSFDSPRRLRVGYISPDFRQHSVTYFFEPILSGHNREQIEVFCYSNVARPDAATQRLRSQADQWRDIAGVSDERVTNLIRDDRIDILVDLAGHTAEHRLLTFARRAAPVQVTYLGYPNTTGVATMDYRLTDADSDPPGMTESHYVEQLVRLPQGFLCYKPPENAPPVRDDSSSGDGHVVFGTFNNFAKVTPQIVALWSQILLAVPRSILLIKAETLGDDDTQKAVRSWFTAHGVDSGRIELLGREPSFTKHLETYHRIDIGLDTFPYHGTTTTCEAMWMGVPVVTLAGKAHVSRVGVSLLGRVGLDELIAHTPPQYVAIASELARDGLRRRQIAASLRDRMRASPLTQPKNFVANLESAYRQMWQARCAS